MIYKILTDADGFVTSWARAQADEDGNVPAADGVTYFDRTDALFATIADGAVDHNGRPELDPELLFDTYRRPKWKRVDGDAVLSTKPLEAREVQQETRKRLRAAYGVEAELALLRKGLANPSDADFVAYIAAAEQIDRDVAALT